MIVVFAQESPAARQTLEAFAKDIGVELQQTLQRAATGQ